MKRILPLFILLILFSANCQKKIQLSPDILELPYPNELDDEMLNKDIATALSKVWTSFQKGFIEDANFNVKKSLHAYPNSPPLWVMQGYINIALGNVKKAEKNFINALEIKQNYPTALNALALLAFKNADYPKAYELYNSLSSQFPNFPYAKVKLNITALKAVEFYKTNAQNAAKHYKFSKAIELYKKAIIISPTIWELHFELAKLFIEKKDFVNANVYLQLATNLNPDNILIRETFADSLFNAKDHKHAIEQYKFLLSIDPKNSNWLSKKEECQRQLKFLQLPSEFQNIESIDKITRALFSAYLIYKIPILGKLNPIKSYILIDVNNHWAKDFMIQIANLDILEPNPNHTFLPNSYINRNELALAINKLLYILSIVKPDINLNYASSEIIIADISKSSLLYKTIYKVVSLGIMNLKSKNHFSGDSLINGKELIQTVSKIEMLFSQTK